MTVESTSEGAAVWLITGAQASGKSTVADLLARQFERGVHVRGGQFYRWAVRGWVQVDDVAHPDEVRRHLDLRYRLSPSLPTSTHRPASPPSCRTTSTATTSWRGSGKSAPVRSTWLCCARALPQLSNATRIDVSAPGRSLTAARSHRPRMIVTSATRQPISGCGWTPPPSLPTRPCRRSSGAPKTPPSASRPSLSELAAQSCIFRRDRAASSAGSTALLTLVHVCVNYCHSWMCSKPWLIGGAETWCACSARGPTAPASWPKQPACH